MTVGPPQPSALDRDGNKVYSRGMTNTQQHPNFIFGYLAAKTDRVSGAVNRRDLYFYLPTFKAGYEQGWKV